MWPLDGKEMGPAQGEEDVEWAVTWQPPWTEASPMHCARVPGGEQGLRGLGREEEA